MPTGATTRVRWLAVGAVALLLFAAAAHAGRGIERGPQKELESEHFRIVYRAGMLSTAQVENARGLAEQAWEKCLGIFEKAPSQKIRLDLTPDLLGASGFASPGDAQSRPQIGVRFSELDYLGVSPDYIILHEVAHIFSGALTRTPLGEGIADWAAGSFAGVPLAPWWGPALRGAGLWVDPDGLFVSGDYPASRDVDARTRTAVYSESALLVRFLVDSFGWKRFAAFADRYRETRGSLASNDMFRKSRAASRPGAPGLGRPPDADKVRRTVKETLGEPWEALRERWEAWMAAEPPPAGQASKLVLGQELYGAIRNYEVSVLRRGRRVSDGERREIRRLFVEANQAFSEGAQDAARAKLDEARARIQALRRPMAVTWLEKDEKRRIPWFQWRAVSRDGRARWALPARS